MRSKLVAGGLAVAVAFLLATNPVVSEAAGQITGKQIKNNSVTGKDVKDGKLSGADVADGSLEGKDVKDGSLAAADLAPGTIPVVPPAPAAQLKAVSRWLSPDTNVPVPESAALSFTGATATVVVDGNDTVLATGQMDVFGDTVSDDYYYSVCARPVGSAAAPTAIGGTVAVSNDNDILVAGGQSTSVSRSVAGVLAAGSYDIGTCARADVANTGVVSQTLSSGTVMVIDSSTSIGAGPARGVPADDEE